MQSLPYRAHPARKATRRRVETGRTGGHGVANPQIVADQSREAVYGRGYILVCLGQRSESNEVTDTYKQGSLNFGSDYLRSVTSGGSPSTLEDSPRCNLELLARLHVDVV